MVQVTNLIVGHRHIVGGARTRRIVIVLSLIPKMCCRSWNPVIRNGLLE